MKTQTIVNICMGMSIADAIGGLMAQNVMLAVGALAFGLSAIYWMKDIGTKREKK